MNADTMDNWDEKKLEEVVNKKHGEAEKKKAKTQIVNSGRKCSCHLDVTIDVIWLFFFFFFLNCNQEREINK